MKTTVAQKLALSTALILTLMVISAAVAYIRIAEMNRNLTTVMDHTFPAVSACDELLNGLNHSAASLRGYILMGSDPRQAEFFRNERRRAWESIDAALENLDSLYPESGAEANRRLNTIRSNLDTLRQSQQEVEDIALREANVPAVEQFRRDAIPQADRLLAGATAAIEAQANEGASAERLALLKSLTDFRISLSRSLMSVHRFLVDGEPALRQDFELHRQANRQAFDEIEARLEMLGENLRGEWVQFRTLRPQIEELLQNIIELRESPQWNQANYLVQTQAAPTTAVVRTELEAFKQSAGGRMADDRRRLLATGNAVTWTLIAATALAIFLGATISAILGRKLIGSVRQLVGAMDAVTEGDLTGEAVRASTDDEIGQLAEGYNLMVRSLRKVLAEAARMCSETAAASHQIAASSQQQVATMNQTATSLNQITGSAEEFKTAMQEFSDRARAVQDAADETAKLAAGGRTLTGESVTQIEQVRDNALSAGRSVLGLSEQMQRIGEITATVNDIAEQTKLLALNASIEAARAGDEGRGFAVVAAQVRELANQSKQSAVRIETLISDTQRSMQDVAGKIEEGRHLSDAAADLIRRMMQSFEEIARAVEQTRDAMVQINTAASEQGAGISELAGSISEIDSGTKESLAAAEQTQQSIVAIDGRIRALNETVARFKT